MLRKAIEMDGNLDSLENLGMVHYQNGEWESAEEQFGKVLSSEPERTRSLVMRERIKLELSKGCD